MGLLSGGELKKALFTFIFTFTLVHYSRMHWFLWSGTAGCIGFFGLGISLLKKGAKNPRKSSCAALQNRVVDDVDSSMLSSHALEALKEFLAKQGGATVSEEADDHPDVALVPEDWQLSQF